MDLNDSVCASHELTVEIGASYIVQVSWPAGGPRTLFEQRYDSLASVSVVSSSQLHLIQCANR